MRRILSGEPGLAAVVLVVVIAWALVAVLLLTGTLLAARRIDKDVAMIRPEVGNIGKNTAMIKLAGTTERVSGQIATAAVPLTGQLDQTLTSVHSIDRHAKSILGRVGAINQTAGSINSTVHAINDNASAINGTVHAIDANAGSINSNVLGINASARGINASAQGINASARGINASAQGINSSVKGIKGNATTILSTVGLITVQVVGINNRADVVGGLGLALKSDFDPILAGVGAIAGHSRSICQSMVFNQPIFPPDPGPSCQ